MYANHKTCTTYASSIQQITRYAIHQLLWERNGKWLQQPEFHDINSTHILSVTHLYHIAKFFVSFCRVFNFLRPPYEIHDTSWLKPHIMTIRTKAYQIISHSKSNELHFIGIDSLFRMPKNQLTFSVYRKKRRMQPTQPPDLIWVFIVTNFISNTTKKLSLSSSSAYAIYCYQNLIISPPAAF